jgi:hypothetical protein
VPKTPGSGRGKKASATNGDDPSSPSAKITKRKASAKKPKEVKEAASSQPEDEASLKAEAESLNALVKEEEEVVEGLTDKGEV